MTTAYYSNLWALAPNRGTAAYIARSPNIDTVAKSIKDVVTVAVTASLIANDTFLISPVLPAGCKLQKFIILPATALDSSTGLTIDVGWTSSAAAVISATAAMRNNTTAVSATDTQIILGTASAAGDNLVVTIHDAPTTPLTTGAVVTIIYEILYP